MSSRHFLLTVVLVHITCVLAILPLTSPAFAEWVDWIVDTGISFTYKMNINNAFVESDERNDRVITPSITFGRAYQLADFTRASLSAEFAYDFHDDFTDLSHLNAGVAISIKHKFGVGLKIPWIQATGSVSRLDFQGNRWDSNLYTLSLSLGKRFHERVDAALAYTFEFRDGDTSPATFDHLSHTGTMNMNFLLTGKTLLSLKYSLRSGDIAAVCSPDSFARVQDIARDVQFDDTFEKGWCLYKIDATTHIFGVNLSYAFFGGHASLNLGYERKEGDISRFTYSNDTVWVSINHSY